MQLQIEKLSRKYAKPICVFQSNKSTADQQGNLYVTADLPDNGVLFSYLLSFGDNVEILEPANVREQMKEKLISMLQKYET